MKVTVHRKAHFNAAHRLFNSAWSDAKNAEVFGKCSNPNFHGHNYELIVSVSGPINPQTGYVIDMKLLKELIKTEYETPRSLAPALILAIQRALKDLFLFFLSLNAYCKDLIFDCFAVLNSLLLAP